MTVASRDTAAPVFISYARSASLESARGLRSALAAIGIDAFLDESGIETGDQFPAALMDALLGSRIVVVLPEPLYFTRWYCLWEWRTALIPFLKACERPQATQSDRIASLAGLVVLLPASGAAGDLDRFPPELRDTQWPRASDLASAAEWIARELRQVHRVLADRIDAQLGAGATDALRASLSEVVRLPYPRSFQNIPRVPLVLQPSLGERFVGRTDDLWRIDYVLVTAMGGVKESAFLSGALQGLGGVGKTRLALEYLHRFGPKSFPGGVFWINGRAPPTELEVAHHQIVSALRSARGEPPPPALAAYRDASLGLNLSDDLVRSFEALPRDQAAIVVVDDIPEPADAPPPLDYWAPMHGLAAVLTTSRFREAGGGSVATPIWLGVLQLDPAVRVLVHGLPDATVLERTGWEQIAGWVGRLPLALTLLNAAMASGTISPEEVLTRAKSGRSQTRELDQAMEALRNSVPPGSLRGVTEAFMAAYERLPAAAQMAARLVAHGAPDPIPEALVAQIGEGILPDSVRTLLVNRSLITRFPGASPPLFGAMHGVLGDFLRVQASNVGDASACMSKFGSALHELFMAAPVNDPRNWALLEACLPHSRAIIERASARPELALLVVRLQWGIGELFVKQGAYDEARELLTQVLASTTSTIGRDTDFAIGNMMSLASALEGLGDFQGARTLLEEAVERGERLFSSEHLWIIMAKSNLAGVLCSVGELGRALTLATEAVAAAERVLKPEDTITLNAKDALAATLLAAGDLVNAFNLTAIVFRARSETLGLDHASTLSTLERFATIAFAIGDFATARSARERIVAQHLAQYGPDHATTLQSMITLAVSLREGKEGAEARRLLDEVIARSQAQTWEAKLTLRLAKMNVALIDLDEGKAQQAQAALEEIVDDLGGMHGGEDLATLRARLSLAEAFLQQGKAARAREIQEDVLSIMRRTVPPTHMAFSHALGQLAGTLEKLGDDAGAQRLRDENAKISETLRDQKASYRFEPR